MTREIQERIAQVQRGEVPDGYRRGKLGIVPMEWQVVSFRQMFAPLNRRNTTGNTNVLTISAQNGLISQTKFFSKNIASQNTDNYFLLKRGDFAYNKSYSNGYPFGVIKPLRLYENGIVSPLYICCSPTDENQCPEYYAQYFDAGLMNREIHAFAQEGARNHGLLNVSVYDFFDSLLLFPPLAEQQKIAAILSAQDKVIELKERLLTEKRRQKKYLMQQLLTGKQRLPGFNGEWKMLQARNVFQSVTDKNHNGDLEVLSATQDKGIIPRSQTDIDIKYDDSALPTYKKVRQENFVISLRSFQGGIEYSAYEGLVSPAYTVLESKIPIVSAYYKQYFKSSRYIAQLQVAVYGIRDGKQISYDDFGFIAICYPPVDEQNAIADILSTADREIDLLQRGLEQEKRRKKALSQLLLTGLVRVDDTPAPAD